MEELERLQRLYQLADLVVDKLRLLLETVEMTPQGLKHITGTMKDVKEVQMLKDPNEKRQEQDVLLVKLEEALQRLSS